ncbi:MAG TPA: N-acetylmuramoyl-L-alanine amidase, partial [Hellea balneolensis]|nr:N-acetylmuramoyl-L-alanine amidase [Hellea balneolensis]
MYTSFQISTFTSVKIREMLLIVAAFLSTSCASTGKSVKLPSENYNGRVSIIVIHHTSANFESSVNILTKKSSRPVSSHYLVPDPSDETYT